MNSAIGRKGQSAVEVVIISVVLLGFMLAAALLMTQKNLETAQLSEIQGNTILCERISGTVTGFNANKDYSQVMLQGLQKDVRIEKGSILIGSIGCVYSGQAWKQANNTGDVEQDYEDDFTGFNLEKGKTYKVKKIDIGVVFCENSEAWC